MSCLARSLNESARSVVVFDGYRRPMVTVRDYLELVERSTYRGDRVRP